VARPFLTVPDNNVLMAGTVRMSSIPEKIPPMIEFLTRLDVTIFTLINSHHNNLFDNLFLIISQLGNGWVAVPLVAAVIILATPRARLARALLYAVLAGTLAGIANTQIKRAVHRPRPIIYFESQAVRGEGPVPDAYEVHCVGTHLRENSFPSGHAATAFAAAAILALLYGGYFSLGFVPALLVAYSRVYLGVHFPGDVLGGAVLGSVCVLLLAVFSGLTKHSPVDNTRERVC
jgi:undecaprenyl-diphosphatase